jgi:hypothetical protein
MTPLTENPSVALHFLLAGHTGSMCPGPVALLLGSLILVLGIH